MRICNKIILKKGSADQLVRKVMADLGKASRRQSDLVRVGLVDEDHHSAVHGIPVGKVGHVTENGGKNLERSRKRGDADFHQ